MNKFCYSCGAPQELFKKSCSYCRTQYRNVEEEIDSENVTYVTTARYTLGFSDYRKVYTELKQN